MIRTKSLAPARQRGIIRDAIIADASALTSTVGLAVSLLLAAFANQESSRATKERAVAEGMAKEKDKEAKAAREAEKRVADTLKIAQDEKNRAEQEK